MKYLKCLVFHCSFNWDTFCRIVATQNIFIFPVDIFTWIYLIFLNWLPNLIHWLINGQFNNLKIWYFNSSFKLKNTMFRSYSKIYLLWWRYIKIKNQKWYRRNNNYLRKFFYKIKGKAVLSFFEFRVMRGENEVCLWG